MLSSFEIPTVFCYISCQCFIQKLGLGGHKEGKLISFGGKVSIGPFEVATKSFRVREHGHLGRSSPPSPLWMKPWLSNLSRLVVYWCLHIYFIGKAVLLKDLSNISTRLVSDKSRNDLDESVKRLKDTHGK